MMAEQEPMRVVFDAGKLTDAQRDGVACVLCGDEYAPHTPCGVVDGGQVFACTVHSDYPTWCPAAVLQDEPVPDTKE